jgi:hypothetical protein
MNIKAKVFAVGDRVRCCVPDCPECPEGGLKVLKVGTNYLDVEGTSALRITDAVLVSSSSQQITKGQIVKYNGRLAEVQAVEPNFIKLVCEGDKYENWFWASPADLMLTTIDESVPASEASVRSARCECGSEAIGYTTHSTWCPRHD